MNAKDIRLGTKLEIEIPDFSAKTQHSPSNYISQLIDVVDGETISIAAPMTEGRLKFLINGLKVVIYFLNSRQELLCFNAIVREHKKIGPLDTFTLKIEGEFTKIQRRRFYRLETTLSCQYQIETRTLLASELNSDKFVFPQLNQAELKKAFVKNISGSGLCIVVEEELGAGTVLDITVNLEDLALIRVYAEVVRHIKSQGQKHELGVHFLKIDRRDADILNKFIFEKQRIMLKNR